MQLHRQEEVGLTARFLRTGNHVVVLFLFLAATFGMGSGSASAGTIPLLDIGPAGFVGQAQQGPFDQPVLLTSYADFTTVFGASTAGLTNPQLAPSAAAFFANGGSRLWVVRTAGADDASLIGVDGGFGSRTGLQAFIDVGEVGAVAIPGVVSAAVQTAMIAHCETMEHRMAILDPVSSTDPNAVIAQRSGLATTDGHAALYFPWVVAAPAGVSLTLPPSGFVAGRYADTPPPESPAGPTNGVVNTATDVSYAVDNTLQNTLNPLGINAIRYFAGPGVLVFGARTLAGDEAWQYVATRRSGIALSKSIEDGTAWAVFEPNDETLWAQLRTDVGDFMLGLFQAGWFQGSSANDAYFVRCDITTMTPADIAAGRTVILVGFAPVQPAEFVVLQIVHERPPSVSVPHGSAGLAFRPPRPNPARTHTTLSFDLPRAEFVVLRIIDISGRTVRTLATGESMAAGHHNVSWNGCNQAGVRLPSGLYMARLQVGGRVLTRRIALLQ